MTGVHKCRKVTPKVQLFFSEEDVREHPLSVSFYVGAVVAFAKDGYVSAESKFLCR